MSKWTDETPTEPGKYWFYGSIYNEERKELHYVKIIKISNGVTYVREGHFLYPKKECNGVWQPITLPELPTN